MNNHLIKNRLRKACFMGRIIARVPFVRCVILNGSLTGKNHKSSSDIDILIIAKKGHVFTARFFIVFFATIFRIKRPKDKFQISDNQCGDSVIVKPHAGKFCFNYFLTEDFLKIPTGRGDKIDRYCADNYSKSKYIAGEIKLYKRFMTENKLLFQKYGFEIRNSKLEIRNKSIIHNSKFIILQKFSEFLFGSWFERWTKKFQTNNIESDPRTKKYPELIVFNDKELRFHPPKRKNYS